MVLARSDLDSSMAANAVELDTPQYLFTLWFSTLSSMGIVNILFGPVWGLIWGMPAPGITFCGSSSSALEFSLHWVATSLDSQHASTWLLDYKILWVTPWSARGWGDLPSNCNRSLRGESRRGSSNGQESNSKAWRLLCPEKLKCEAKEVQELISTVGSLPPSQPPTSRVFRRWRREGLLRVLPFDTAEHQSGATQR